MTKFRQIFKGTSVVAIAMLAVAIFSMNASASTYAQLRGDVNNDGKINVSDAVALKQYIAGRKLAGTTLESADLDRSGVVNSVDYSEMEKIIINGDKASFVVKGAKKEFGENTTFLDNGKYFGRMQRDGNVVIYRRDKNKDTAVFHTGTYKNASNYRNHKLVFQPDGNIVLYAVQKSNGQTVARWHSRTYLGDKDAYTAYLDNNGILQWTTVDRMVWSSDSNFITKESQRALKRLNEGYEYSTYRNAAVDFIFAFGRVSVEENTEYDAAINKESNNKYKVSWGELKGDPREPGSYDGTGAPIPFVDNTVAYVHTHGAEVCKENNCFSDTDLELAIEHNCVAYLGAPNGEIRVFVPNEDEVKERFKSGRVISANAPH